MNNNTSCYAPLHNKSISETEHKLFFADAIENQAIRRSMGHTI